MKKIFFYFLLANFQLINAQNYIEYHNTINKARVCEKNDQKEKAMDLYLSAFSKYPFIPSKHLWRGIIVANDLNKVEDATKLLNQLLSQSIEEYFIWRKQQAKRLLIFRNDTLFDSKFPLPARFFTPRWNHLYKDTIQKLRDRDRKCRTLDDSDKEAVSYFNKVNDSKKLLKYDTFLYLKVKSLNDNWILTDSINFHILNNIYKEKKIMLDERDIDISVIYFQAIALAHSCRNTMKYLESFMIENIKNGKFYPQDYAWIVDRTLNQKGDAPFYHWDIINVKPGIETDVELLTKKQKRIINNRRKKIGLPLLPETMITYRDIY